MMKLTNLSLAVLVAIGVAACGGSDDNNSNKPADNGNKNQNQNQNQNQNNNQNNQAADQNIVDPTGTKVVDNKDLSKEQTVGTLQYVRRDGSRYDREVNPNQPASASPLLGVDLGTQNPSLTNIVLARQQVTRPDGVPVRAQFAGMDNPVPLKNDGTANHDSKTEGNGLQEENFRNVDILAGMYQQENRKGAQSDWTHTNKQDLHTFNNVDDKGKINVAKRPVIGTELSKDAAGNDVNQFYYPLYAYSGAKEGADATNGVVSNLYTDSPFHYFDNAGGRAVPAGAKSGIRYFVPGNTQYIGDDFDADAPLASAKPQQSLGWPVNQGPNSRYEQTHIEPSDKLSAIIDRTYYRLSDGGKDFIPAVPPATTPTDAVDAKPAGDKKYKDTAGKDIYFYRGVSYKSDGTTVEKRAVTLADARSKSEMGSRYGSELIWWSAPETAFENEFTQTGKDQYSKDKVTKLELPNIHGDTDEDIKQAYLDGRGATNGLVRIGNGMNTLGQELNYNKETGKWEDHHNTTTRIFGRYHLAYANLDKKTINPVGLNSYTGAKSFIAEYESDNSGKVGKATQYSLGAVPNTLQYVQYGRVSTNLDLDAGEGGYSDHFMRNPYLHKNDEQGVDNYFYRGTNATTIAQMEALPSNQTAVYNGHALMYGIDNDFHGGANRNLPNAFAGGSNGLGLGNFVQANVNFGQKRVTGNVYNEWLTDPAKNVTVKDNLVQFQGKIEGNTVVGTADRTYIGGDDNATFKASFFGEKAEEMGGSFNSVTDTDKYGPAYGTNDWGGVFGATKGGSGNTFQGDDSANKYGGL